MLNVRFCQKKIKFNPLVPDTLRTFIFCTLGTISSPQPTSSATPEGWQEFKGKVHAHLCLQASFHANRNPGRRWLDSLLKFRLLGEPSSLVESRAKSSRAKSRVRCDRRRFCLVAVLLHTRPGRRRLDSLLKFRLLGERQRPVPLTRWKQSKKQSVESRAKSRVRCGCATRLQQDRNDAGRSPLPPAYSSKACETLTKAGRKAECIVRG